MELLWAEVSKMIAGAEPVDQISVEEMRLLIASQQSNEISKRWFLGGLEFYGSL